MRNFFFGILTLAASLFSELAHAQLAPCAQPGSYSEFISNSSEQISGNPSLRFVTGTRYFCAGQMVVSQLLNQFELRDASNNCATILDGQLAPATVSPAVASLCPTGSSISGAQYAYVHGPLSQSLSHISFYCSGLSISPRYRLFPNGSVIPSVGAFGPLACR